MQIISTCFLSQEIIAESKCKICEDMCESLDTLSKYLEDFSLKFKLDLHDKE